METATETWSKVKLLFDAALQHDSATRTSFLDANCADEDLRALMDKLLDCHQHAGSFLANPAVDLAPHLLDTVSSGLTSVGVDSSSRPSIDHYQLLRMIGEGGMGQVWLAEQTAPVRRQVALKLIKAGQYDRSAIQRFELERQSLAIMDHPFIAKVFEAGTTAEGQPFFVMDYVNGVPITEYCDSHKMSTGERLELFTQVCDAVQHAHQKAIIHRDLKPSNILVAEVDGRAVPKIIDFGVAKALTQKLTADTMFTRTGALVGTPQYMSPEQASSAGEDIDTRTDVYSLGIIFYELLAGAPPIDLRNVGFEELLRRLREEDPQKPSSKVSTRDPATSTDLAQKRQTEPQALAKQLRGELDSIALKALEKERSRRYGSASEFAVDIKRYLNHETVLAVPPSLAYRARKFGRRYRVALVTASAFALVLVVATVFSIRQSIRANRETAVAAAVSDFLQNDLLAQAGASAQSGPSTKPDPDLKVRTALDRAAGRIEGKFANQPEVEGSIRDTVGWTYADLGLYPEARKQLELALELRKRVLGSEDAKTLSSMARLGRVAFSQGRYAEAEALERQALEAQHRILSPEHPDTLTSMSNLANVYGAEGKYMLAEALLTKTFEARKRVLGQEHPDTLRSMNNLAIVYDQDGKYAEAEALDVQTLQIRKRVLGQEHPATLGSMSNLALVYQKEGKYAQAEALDVQTSEIRTRLLGSEHPQTLASMNNLAGVYDLEGKYGQAEKLYTRTLEVKKRMLGPENPDTLTSMNNLALVYAHEGKYAQAEALFTQTLEIRKRVLGPEHPETASTVYNLGCVAARRGDKDRAIALLTQSVNHGLAAGGELGMENDTDLTTLLGDPRFAALVAHAKQVAEAKQQAPASQVQ